MQLVLNQASLPLCVPVYTVKNFVSRYIHNGTSVFGCFLDAFDLVDHDILFNILLDKGLPVVVVRFLRFWYITAIVCLLELKFVCSIFCF